MSPPLLGSLSVHRHRSSSFVSGFKPTSVTPHLPLRNHAHNLSHDVSPLRPVSSLFSVITRLRDQRLHSSHTIFVDTAMFEPAHKQEALLQLAPEEVYCAIADAWIRGQCLRYLPIPQVHLLHPCKRTRYEPSAVCTPARLRWRYLSCQVYPRSGHDGDLDVPRSGVPRPLSRF